MSLGFAGAVKKPYALGMKFKAEFHEKQFMTGL